MELHKKLDDQMKNVYEEALKKNVIFLFNFFRNKFIWDLFQHGDG